MASTLAQLAEKTLVGKALSSLFYSENNNSSFVAESAAVVVSIKNKDEQVGYAVMTLLNNSQAYCMLGEVNEKYENHTIWIEQSETEAKSNAKVFEFKVVMDVPEKVEVDATNGYERQFLNFDGKSVRHHLVDCLINVAGKTNNYHLNSNFSVDIVNEGSDVASWRDHCGFVVTDKNTFEEISIDRFELLALEEASTDIEIEAITADNLDVVLDYDSEVSIFDRTNHVTALIESGQVKGQLAMKGDTPCGYVLFTEERVLQCYGDNDTVIKKLLAGVAGSTNNATVNMFTRVDGSSVMDSLRERSQTTRRVLRLHSRNVPTGIKWSLIACPNMGLNLY